MWPVLLFDDDGEPCVCHDDAEVSGYVEDYPEEVGAAVDADGRPLAVVRDADGWTVRPSGGPDATADALDRLRGYAQRTRTDADALVGGGLRYAMEVLAEQGRRARPEVRAAVTSFLPRLRVPDPPADATFVSAAGTRTDAAVSAVGTVVLGGVLAFLAVPVGWAVAVCVVTALAGTGYVVLHPVMRHWLEGDVLVEQTRRHTWRMPLGCVDEIELLTAPSTYHHVRLRQRSTGASIDVPVEDETAALRAEVGRRVAAHHPGHVFERRAMQALGMWRDGLVGPGSTGGEGR